MGMMLRRHRKRIVTTEEVVEIPEKTEPIIPVKKPDYSEMKYDELRTFARQQGVDIRTYSTKAEMIEQLDAL